MASELDECLVPIRLDIEYENVKIKDTFSWNLFGNVFWLMIR
jgi:hypothetical protein